MSSDVSRPLLISTFGDSPARRWCDVVFYLLPVTKLKLPVLRYSLTYCLGYNEVIV